ncbi:MAG: hypothetical protein ACKPKO_13750, partial [Candidatus Fonsibacter sp.]
CTGTPLGHLRHQNLLSARYLMKKHCSNVATADVTNAKAFRIWTAATVSDAIVRILSDWRAFSDAKYLCNSMSLVDGSLVSSATLSTFSKL